jgi:hypothetical protein
MTVTLRRTEKYSLQEVQEDCTGDMQLLMRTCARLHILHPSPWMMLWWFWNLDAWWVNMHSAFKTNYIFSHVICLTSDVCCVQSWDFNTLKYPNGFWWQIWTMYSLKHEQGNLDTHTSKGNLSLKDLVWDVICYWFLCGVHVLFL